MTNNIIIIDDEANIRKTLSLVLEAAGHKVDVAGDGDEALGLCRDYHPDIAFVDLHMPKMEGLEVLSHIRAISPKTAVVIITAYGSAANAVEAMKLGAVDFIEKPFDPKIIGILAEEILLRQRLGTTHTFDDLMHLAELARERKAPPCFASSGAAAATWDRAPCGRHCSKDYMASPCRSKTAASFLRMNDTYATPSCCRIRWAELPRAHRWRPLPAGASSA